MIWPLVYCGELIFMVVSTYMILWRGARQGICRSQDEVMRRFYYMQGHVLVSRQEETF